MPFHAHGERLQAAKHEVAVERSGHGAGRVLYEAERLGERVVVEGDEAADHVGVPAEVLRRRVDDDVRAVLEWALEVRRGERVVDDAPRAVSMRDGGNRLDVDAREKRVRRRLEPHDHRVIWPGHVERGGIGEVDRTPRAAGGLVHLGDQAERAAVRVVAEQDALSRAHEGAQDRVLRRQPARERQAVRAVLERGQADLERGAGRVAGAGVLVALVVAHRVLGERRRQRDGRHDRARRRVGVLAGMDGARLEAEGRAV